MFSIFCMDKMSLTQSKCMFLNFIGEAPPPSFFEIMLNFKNIKCCNANQCLPRRHKNKHWSEWATFEEHWYALEYKAPLISASTNFLQPSRSNFYLQNQTNYHACQCQISVGTHILEASLICRKTTVQWESNDRSSQTNEQILHLVFCLTMWP